MINTRRTKRIIALAVGLSLVAAACGGDDDDTTADEPSEEPADEPADGDEPADADDERGGDVGQDRHLEQADVNVAQHFQPGGVLAEEESAGGAEAECDQDPGCHSQGFLLLGNTGESSCFVNHEAPLIALE